MNQKQEIESLKKTIEIKNSRIQGLENLVQIQREELNHYRTAVAAVKWLWDEAQKQQAFQL